MSVEVFCFFKNANNLHNIENIPVNQQEIICGIYTCNCLRIGPSDGVEESVVVVTVVAT
jgi:hypothetical protein